MTRLIRFLAVVSVVAAVLGAVAYAYLPGLWVQIDRFVAEKWGWTEEARQHDPVGYLSYVIRHLERDLTNLNNARRELLSQIAQISRKIHEQEALLLHAQRLAHVFRAENQSAQRTGQFPIIVHGGSYSADQAKHQVAMLLAEADGYQASIERLRQVREEAERQLQSVTVRLNRTEAELAALAVGRELVEVRKIVTKQNELLARVESLREDNKRVLAENPVRNVRELLAAAEVQPAHHPSPEEVEAFLSATSLSTDRLSVLPVAPSVSEFEAFLTSERETANGASDEGQVPRQNPEAQPDPPHETESVTPDNPGANPQAAAQSSEDPAAVGTEMETPSDNGIAPTSSTLNPTLGEPARQASQGNGDDGTPAEPAASEGRDTSPHGSDSPSHHSGGTGDVSADTETPSSVRSGVLGRRVSDSSNPPRIAADNRGQTREQQTIPPRKRPVRPKPIQSQF